MTDKEIVKYKKEAKKKRDKLRTKLANVMKKLEVQQEVIDNIIEELDEEDKVTETTKPSVEPEYGTSCLRIDLVNPKKKTSKNIIEM